MHGFQNGEPCFCRFKCVSVCYVDLYAVAQLALVLGEAGDK